MSETIIIAPCGMNCSLCYAFQRKKNRCPGCGNYTGCLMKSRIQCRIKNCINLVNESIDFCIYCSDYPCRRLLHLDKRYKTKYSMSMIENLEYIKNYGLEEFIANENKRWACSNCGTILSVHKPECLNCGAVYERRTY